MKPVEIFIMLVVFSISGCSEPNPLKWHPMDLSPPAYIPEDEPERDYAFNVESPAPNFK